MRLESASFWLSFGKDARFYGAYLLKIQIDQKETPSLGWIGISFLGTTALYPLLNWTGSDPFWCFFFFFFLSFPPEPTPFFPYWRKKGVNSWQPILKVIQCTNDLFLSAKISFIIYPFSRVKIVPGSRVVEIWRDQWGLKLLIFRIKLDNPYPSMDNILMFSHKSWSLTPKNLVCIVELGKWALHALVKMVFDAINWWWWWWWLYELSARLRAVLGMGLKGARRILDFWTFS